MLTLSKIHIHDPQTSKSKTSIAAAAAAKPTVFSSILNGAVGHVSRMCPESE